MTGGDAFNGEAQTPRWPARIGRLTRPLPGRRMRAVVRRLLLFLVTLWLVLTLTWVLTRVVGGDPAVKLAGPEPTPAAVHAIEVRLGLNQPLIAQYFAYLGNLVRGNLGIDYSTEQSVGREVLDRGPATLQLVAFGMLFALLIGVGLGVAGALRRGRIADQLGRVVSVAGLSVPDFFVGLLLAYLLFYRLGAFPAPIGQLPVGVTPPARITGFYLIDGVLTGRPGVSWAFIKQMFLPALTLGLVYSAPILRLTRASMLESLGSDAVVYAEACGLRRNLVIRYALRQSMTLIVTYLGILLAALLGGDVLVEQVYSWGGLGQFGVGAVSNDNYPAIQAFVLVVGVAALVIYTTVDIVYMVIDPRVRLT
jgi:ABC-type dipeptide/oligopeptide/nickel transport system permease component